MSAGRPPNHHLIGNKHARELLATPALLLDLDALEHNIALTSRHCRQNGIGLRPHAKTHKCSRIAQLQIAAGALGPSVATLREAEVMMNAGVRGVLITSPIVGVTKIDRLVSLARRDKTLMIVVDNPANAAELDNRFKGARVSVSALIDIDVGMHRTGVADSKSALSLARKLADSKFLEIRGTAVLFGDSAAHWAIR